MLSLECEYFVDDNKSSHHYILHLQVFNLESFEVITYISNCNCYCLISFMMLKINNTPNSYIYSLCYTIFDLF